jgi:hypothetical protein
VKYDRRRNCRKSKAYFDSFQAEVGHGRGRVKKSAGALPRPAAARLALVAGGWFGRRKRRQA